MGLMETKNNWVVANLDQRLDNPELDFSVTLFPYEFEETDFETAAKNVALELGEKHKDLYLALSGGLDSEFILRLFLGLGIKITPIIVSHYSNQDELAYAFSACQDCGVKPVFLEPNHQKTFSTYNDLIFKKLNGSSIYSIFAVIAAEYAANQGGVLMTGGNVFGEQGDSIDFFTLSEFDFYYSIFYPELIHISPLMYTPQIVEAFSRDLRDDWALHKARLFNIKRRNKMTPVYNDSMLRILKYMFRSRSKVPANKCLWPRSDVFQTDSFLNGIVGLSQRS